MMVHISPYTGLMVARSFYTDEEQDEPDEKDGFRVPQDLMVQIFRELSIITLRRCFLVSRQWKRIASLDILWEPHVKEFIDLSCNFSRFKYIKNTHKFYPTDAFIERLNMYSKATTCEILRLAKEHPFSEFIGKQETLIRNPEELLSTFTKALERVQPFVTGIVRCDFIASKHFFFEAFFIYGTYRSEECHIFQEELDPAGLHLDERMLACGLDWKHIEPEDWRNDPKQMPRMLLIHFQMPRSKAWNLDGIPQRFKAIFEQHVSKMKWPI